MRIKGAHFHQYVPPFCFHQPKSKCSSAMLPGFRCTGRSWNLWICKPRSLSRRQYTNCSYVIPCRFITNFRILWFVTERKNTLYKNIVTVVSSFCFLSYFASGLNLCVMWRSPSQMWREGHRLVAGYRSRRSVWHPSLLSSTKISGTHLP